MPGIHHLILKPRKPTISRTSVFFFMLLLITLFLVACGDSTSGTPAPTVPPTLERPRGEVLFMRYCNVCHPGGKMGSGPSLQQLPLTREDVTTYIRHGKGRMPGFGSGAISDEDVTHLVDYVLALR